MVTKELDVFDSVYELVIFYIYIFFYYYYLYLNISQERKRINYSQLDMIYYLTE
jgi:hypothetical protein